MINRSSLILTTFCVSSFTSKRILFSVLKLTEMFRIQLMNISFHLLYYLWAININKIQIWSFTGKMLRVLDNCLAINSLCFYRQHQNSFSILCHGLFTEIFWYWSIDWILWFYLVAIQLQRQICKKPKTL